ncbi:MAG: metalloregulator ArsR/SmtB family transcription factor [Kiritimatiellales bacterium]|nr:metalloregulator ArsR/SmtB family transcription factor [Kiritimatiellales bacterium]
MHTKLRPTLWRTCRVIACESRLQLLWVLFGAKELCVADLARCIGIDAPQASVQLRVLNARGLISSRREKMQVFYRSEANPEVDFASALLDGLNKCYESRMSIKTVIRQATAFTHPRRIEIVKALVAKPLSPGELMKATGMSASALSRNVEKLKTRKMIAKANGKYGLIHPRNRFGHLLQRIACT